MSAKDSVSLFVFHEVKINTKKKWNPQLSRTWDISAFFCLESAYLISLKTFRNCIPFASFQCRHCAEGPRESLSRVRLPRRSSVPQPQSPLASHSLTPNLGPSGYSSPHHHSFDLPFSSLPSPSPPQLLTFPVLHSYSISLPEFPRSHPSVPRLPLPPEPPQPLIPTQTLTRNPSSAHCTFSTFSPWPQGPKLPSAPGPSPSQHTLSPSVSHIVREAPCRRLSCAGPRLLPKAAWLYCLSQ